MILRPTPQDYDELLTVWEASVRSTHHFLAEKDIQFYKTADKRAVLSCRRALHHPQRKRRNCRLYGTER